MNVYDFDGTIYRGDSSLDFYRFCLRRNPLLLRYLPLQVAGMLGFALGLHSKDAYKTAFFSFLGGVVAQREVEAFWESRQDKLAQWYLAQRRPDDVVISASPEWLLKPICDRLGVALIATQADQRTGALLGPNCRGPEKVNRFQELYPGAVIDAFYSDSLSDAPMARLAVRPHLVRGGRLIPWPKGGGVA